MAANGKKKAKKKPSVSTQALRAFATDIFNPGQVAPMRFQPSGFQSLGAQGPRRKTRAAPKPRKRPKKKAR